MDKSELRNRKTPLKLDKNSLKKLFSEESQSENERIEQLQDDKHYQERIKDGEQKDKVTNFLQSTMDSWVYYFKTDFRVNKDDLFRITVEFDFVTMCLFVVAFCTRIYKLSTPNNVVFDELHYGKYISLYMRNIFFFDQHPPFGKQLISVMANFAGYDGNYTFSRIGSPYSENVPIFSLRFIPALCGSILAPCVYKLLLQTKLSRITSAIGGVLIILDNALLTQSRFILMESMLLTFSVLGLLFLLKFQESLTLFARLKYAILSASFYTFAFSVKFAGFYSLLLGFLIGCRHLWKLLSDKTISDIRMFFHILFRIVIFTTIPFCIYVGVFYMHFQILHKAGPHDSIMTSAFQASLEGGLASITKGQPLNVVHGSQITLRHTLGRTCWLHSHPHVYPVRYPDKRGSSHQQQVTCYSFKDVNNWWIVKRPENTDLVVGDKPDVIRHGEEVQLVHGITSRALNSHDVAAAMTPSCQEVSCYIDYNVSMSAQILWKVDVINREQEGPIWHAIRSQVRLIHSATGQALRFSGRQLPDWGFNQHEVVADRVIDQPDTIWNVEEHRYTKTEDQKERERQLINEEMIPTGPSYWSFWDKFIELHSKMLWHSDQIQNHLYASDPLDWPLMNKGIAYWVDKDSNAQIYLLGNVIIWYSGFVALIAYFGLLVIYLLRRRRLCYDLSEVEWARFQEAGEIFFLGYLIHFLPYFFVERTLFLHNYLPAFIFQIMLLCFVVEHVDLIFRAVFKSVFMTFLHRACVVGWLVAIFLVFKKFSVLSYGTTKLSVDDVINLRWKNTWDFILHKDLQ
ncbi:Protein O-mannosyltransferase 1 [Pseudolycoriella hygida]|uniref:Protein O-mannosyltransferase 1 n=1 Tax=Pseudolycoriella hygida TaxID=35572 RepID=A0A9Q0NED3_9DIPT|nr:Protein O-mannosyltransferase 1 [Pseudolycoriella hygida]